ncbi:MAG: hypothetical protein OEW19_21625, partial [Acidobacteriota bacterium]|nr:hypothetical protein [Acidobacteriota bacterium]
IFDLELRRQLREVVLGAIRSDTARAWTLQTDATYVRESNQDGAEAVDSQRGLLAYYTSSDRG